MGHCTIKWCGKNSRTSYSKKDGITFHRYPKDPKLKEMWINATRRKNWFPSAHSVICSRHFTEDCLLQMKNRKRLLSSAIPTRLLPILGDVEEPEYTPKSDLKTEVPQTSSIPAESTVELKKERRSESPTTSLISEPPKCEISKTVPESLSNQDTFIKNRLNRRIVELSEKLVHKNRQIKNLRQNNTYLKKRVSSYKSLIVKLLGNTESTDLLSKIDVTDKEFVQKGPNKKQKNKSSAVTEISLSNRKEEVESDESEESDENEESDSLEEDNLLIPMYAKDAN